MGIPRPSGSHLASGQQSRQREFNFRCAAAPDLTHTLYQIQHPGRNILALFIFALRDGAFCQSHTVFSKDRLQRAAHGLIYQVILLAPFGKVLAAVYDAGQAAGGREGLRRYLLPLEHLSYPGKYLCQFLRFPLGQADIQPHQTAAYLFQHRVLGTEVLAERLQRLIPAFRVGVVSGQRTEHAHTLHQGRGRQNLLFRKIPVIFLHFPVVAHAGEILHIANQQLGDLGMIPSFYIAVKRTGIVLFQFVVHTAADQKRPLPLRRILPAHLPHQEHSKLRPETKTQDIIILQHAGIALDPIQHLSGVVTACHHTGQLQIKVFKRRQLQDKAPDWRIQTSIDCRLKIEEDLLKRLPHHFRRKGQSLLHFSGSDRHAQRKAHGLFQNLTNVRIRVGDLPAFHHAENILAVEEKGLRIQHGHQPRIPKGHHTSVGRSPGQQQKPPVRTIPDQIIQFPPDLLVLNFLKIINQKNAPVLFSAGHAEFRILPGKSPNVFPLYQRVGDAGLSASTGRAEKQHSALFHKSVKAFLNRPSDNHLLRHTAYLHFDLFCTRLTQVFYQFLAGL